MFSDYTALFLDRDGTLIVDRNYLSKPADVQLLPGVKETLHVLKKRKYLFFLFTNQSGIGRGYFTLQEVEICNKRMMELLEFTDQFFTRVCIAPGIPTMPDPYRKPSPKFIFECLDEFQLDPNKCWMVGDKPTDIQAGNNAHIHTIALGDQEKGLADYCCKDFHDILNVLP